MNGSEVNDKLERGILSSSIKFLKAIPGFLALQTPSDLDFAEGTLDSVTEQSYRIDGAWDKSTKTLTLSKNVGGSGLWIPYVGNGSVKAVGIAQMARRGLGTYTPIVEGGGGISWVVTGPFSGCHSAVFSSGNDKVFAHIVTAGDGYTADSVANQVEAIANSMGIPVPPATDYPKVSAGAGEGFVFWTRIGATWYRRVVYAFAGTVMSVEAKTRL